MNARRDVAIHTSEQLLWGGDLSVFAAINVIGHVDCTNLTLEAIGGFRRCSRGACHRRRSLAPYTAGEEKGLEILSVRGRRWRRSSEPPTGMV
jgi:hypothetical protein